MAFLDDLFSEENSTALALGLGLLQPTKSGSFGESLGNAGFLALQVQRQKEEDRRTQKLNEVKLEEVTRKFQEDEKERNAISQIFSQYGTPGNKVSLGDLFIQGASQVPKLGKTGIELKNQEMKSQAEAEKTQQAQLLQQQLMQMTSDPMAQALFAGGQIGPGVSALNRNDAESRRQAKEIEEINRNIETAFSVLPELIGERESLPSDTDEFDEFDETENFKRLVQQKADALRASPESVDLRRDFVQSQKELSKLEDAKNIRERKKQEKELLGTDKTIPSVTKNDIEEVKSSFKSQDKRLQELPLDEDELEQLYKFTANRVKTMTTNGVDKNIALKHSTDFARFNILLGRDVGDLVNLPSPSAKDIKDLEKFDPKITRDFSERQTKFFSEFGYLPGISEFSNLSGTIERESVDPKDLTSLKNIRKSGRQDLIQKAEQIFRSKYGYIP